MVKLLENTFRSVNIGLANEFSLLCHKLGIDVWEVIDAGVHEAVRLHAVTRDRASAGTAFRWIPLYLSWKAKVNGFHPRLHRRRRPGEPGACRVHVVGRVRDALDRGRRPLHAGSEGCSWWAWRYKRDTDDVRESPAVEILHRLAQEGGAPVVLRPVRARGAGGGDVAGRDRRSPPRRSGRPTAWSIVTDHAAFDYEMGRPGGRRSVVEHPRTR